MQNSSAQPADVLAGLPTVVECLKCLSENDAIQCASDVDFEKKVKIDQSKTYLNLLQLQGHSRSQLRL